MIAALTSWQAACEASETIFINEIRMATYVSLYQPRWADTYEISKVGYFT